MKEQVNTKETINYENTIGIFKERGARKARNYTVSQTTDDRWRQFIQLHSGTEIRPGNGINSVIVEFSLLTTMAFMTGNPINYVGELAKKILYPDAIEKVRENLMKLYESLGGS